MKDELMKFSATLFCILGMAAGFSGCAPHRASTVILASNKAGQLQLDYSGPGTYSFSRDENTCIFRIGPASGKALAHGSVTLKYGSSNDVTITIDSSAAEPYEIRLMGFASNPDSSTSEADTRRTMRIEAGTQSLKLQRHVLHTYEFEKP